MTMTLYPSSSLWLLLLFMTIAVAQAWILQVLPKQALIIGPKRSSSLSASSINLNSGDGGGDDSTYPSPLIWQQRSKKDEEWQWRRVADDPSSKEKVAALETWNWCRHFVLPLQLCPWTKRSLETKHALQIFVVPSRDNKSQSLVVEEVAQQFIHFCKEHPALESSAIFFIVFVNDDEDDADEDEDEYKHQTEESSSPSFTKFYEWFVELEDTWELEDVIVAPFHTDWQFAGEPESLQFEKKSPYPTISIVLSKVVEQAGEAATEQIGIHNEALLLSKPAAELRKLWKASIECLGSFE